MRMRKTIAIGMVLVLIAAVFAAAPMNVYAIDPATSKELTLHNDNENRNQWESGDNSEGDAGVVIIIVYILGTAGAIASILTWLGGGEDPDAETYAYAYAGDWGCGQKGSEKDEAYVPDISAESNAGEFTCIHGAKARAHVKAWWEKVEGDYLVGKMDKEPIYGSAPESCYGIAKASAKLKGTTKWEKKIGFYADPDNLHMQLTMNFTEFSIKALDNPIYTRDENSSVEILMQATWGSEALTLFDGLLVNNGTGFEATGDFEQLDLIRSEDGEVTFGSWPTIVADFYVPEGEEITITGSVLSNVYSRSPSVHPPGVGGVVVPVDKFALLAPYIALASTILVATAATAVYVKRVKRRKEKQ
jgi:hypothetical protein